VVVYWTQWTVEFYWLLSEEMISFSHWNCPPEGTFYGKILESSTNSNKNKNQIKQNKNGGKS
jgi:hypothetical protein